MLRILGWLGIVCLGTTVGVAAEQPNVLWITCEDMSPMLGCYGDAFARTPQLDALAAQGIRYTNAFAYTGVCAPSRSCLITGIYPTRLGSMHMRSTTRLPEGIKCFPEYLRNAGYYCTNNAKQDYNFKTPPETWDESSEQAHWRNRPHDKPFFAVFNLETTHQSKVFVKGMNRDKARERIAPEQRHADADVTVPPIHPDTPEFRAEWAWYYDNASYMDAQVGEILQQLKKDGLDDDTIVFFYSDHGTGMPNIKMWAWDRSLRVPLIVRVPEKMKSWSPGTAGSSTDRLVSFVDFAPTVLSLCGVEIPAPMQGSAFLGPAAGEPREYVYAAKDRQGERYDTIRSVHDKRFHYLRNFRPELPWSQFISYVDQHASMRSWQKLHDEGKLSGPPARFFETKPAEELYDVTVDRWETKNLADDPAYAANLKRLREECEAWMLRTGDLGLLPEYELHKRAEGSTPYEIALDPKLNPLQSMFNAAELADLREPPDYVATLGPYSGAVDAALRWWGVRGRIAVGTRPPAADASPDIRIVLAETQAAAGHDDVALAELTQLLKHESPFIRLAALNALDRLGPRAVSVIPAIEQAKMKDPQHPDVAEYVGRMVDYLPGRIRAAAADSKQ